MNFNRENMPALSLYARPKRGGKIIRQNEQTRFQPLLPTLDTPLDIILDYG